MSFVVRRADYFYATIRDEPGEAYKMLAMLAELGTNLLALTAVPVGPTHTQLTIFPEDVPRLENEVHRVGLTLDGPHPALFIQGDDKLGALAEIHVKLHEAAVNVFASSGVTDGKGGFGYIVYVKPADYDKAAKVLGV